MIKYTATRADFAALFEPFGAVNDTVTKTIQVPVWLEFDGLRFGGDMSFFYVGKAGAKGVGK